VIYHGPFGEKTRGYRGMLQMIANVCGSKYNLIGVVYADVHGFKAYDVDYQWLFRQLPNRVTLFWQFSTVSVHENRKKRADSGCK
jgi:hypothetical protein